MVVTRWYLFATLIGLSAILSTSASPTSWKVDDIHLSIIAKDGTKKQEYTLEYPYAIEHVSAGPTDSLKFSFKVLNTERPHQAMLIFQSQDEHADEVMVATSVKSSGKGRVELNFARASPKFRYGTRKYSMTFLMGGPKIDQPFRYTLGHIQVEGPDINPPVRLDRLDYKSLPAIAHQFRPEQKLINRAVSGLFSILALAPFAVLFGLWSQLGLRFEPLKAMAHRPVDFITAMVFFGSLVGIELVFYSYWTHVTLFPVLQYVGALSVIALVSGRSVLSVVQERRLQRSRVEPK
ncbi:hypothetical protein BGZ93_003475 [Podila epicladia]|nr:hypothetical protein BGZ92_006511 [Podila epicladia]KAG0097075.1 hypothetical protein BGZ93_003475 [Podila epicladia]